MKTLALLTTLCLLIAACSNTEIGNIKDVNPATVYTSYYVHYDESNDSMVTFKAQFTFAGPNGTSLVLNPPAKVELDGNAITVDSTPAEGAFYEVKKPLTAGQHILAFTNIDGKVYTNHLNLPGFRLQPLPASIASDGLILNFTGLNTSDSIYISIEDTSETTPNIDTLLAVDNNTLPVPASLFAGFSNGPLTIQVAKGNNRPLDHTTAEGGNIFMMWALAERKTQLKK